MSSRQINFFISEIDYPHIVEFISNQSCVVYQRENEHPVRPTLNSFTHMLGKKFQFYICHDKNTSDVVFEYHEVKKTYFIDIVKSNCIEFSIGGFYPYSSREFHISRLYYVANYYEREQLVNKSNEFIKWAGGFVQTFKKKFLLKNNIYSSHYLTNNFISWIESTNAKKSIDETKFIINV